MSIGNIDRFAPSSIAEFGNGCRNSIGAPGADRNVDSLINQCAGDRKADTATAAGDDGAFAV
jgi:hypothetical protein